MSEVTLWCMAGTCGRFRSGLVFKAHRPVYHSTLGWRVIKKKKKTCGSGHASPGPPGEPSLACPLPQVFFFSLLLSSLELSDTQVYEP